MTLPKSGPPKEEAELEMIRKILIDEFRKYKKTVDDSNIKKGRKKDTAEEKDKSGREKDNNNRKKDKRKKSRMGKPDAERKKGFK